MFNLPCAIFGIESAGWGEMLVLFVVILIVVGPKRLPEAARKLGRMMEMFRRAADEFKSQIMSMDQEPAKEEPSPPYPDYTTQTDSPYPGNEQYANQEPEGGATASRLAENSTADAPKAESLTDAQSPAPTENAS